MNDEQVVSANVKPTQRILGPHVAARAGAFPRSLGTGLGSPSPKIWFGLMCQAKHAILGQIALEAKSVKM